MSALRHGLLLAACLCAVAALAGDDAPPPALEALLAAEPSGEAAATFAEDKRRAAMRAAALGFGARAGLARRGWEIARMLDRHEASLARIYRFRDLMLRAHGFTVMPPVLAETARAFRLGRGADRAATAGRVVRILEPERIVSAPPHWRGFLVRAWPAPEPPAAVLFPRGRAETVRWRHWLREGWAHGAALADDVFAADLDRLNRTFEGLVHWRRAHLAGMASAPALDAERTGVGGDGRVMRIGEIRAALGERARLNLRAGEWRPLPAGDAP